MKRTLLSLVLATVATTAFSATIYKSDNASLTFGAQIRGYINHFNVEHKTDSVLYAKFKQERNDLRTRVWFGGKIGDGQGLELGFFVRGQHGFNYIYSETDSYTDGTYSSTAKGGKHSRYGFILNVGTVHLSYKGWGELKYGKFPVVSDWKFGDDTNVLKIDDKSYNHLSYTAWTAATSFDSAIQYRNTVGNIGFGLSYGKTNQTATTRLSQWAGAFSYNVVDVGKVQAIYANTAKRVTTSAAKKDQTINSFDLAWYSKVAGVNYGVALTYNRDKTYTSPGYSHTNAWSIAAKASYVLNQYFQPYTGISYVHSSTDYTTSSNEIKSNSVRVYLGAKSDVYKYKSLNVRVFLEGGIARAKKDITASNVTTTHDFSTSAVALGVITSF
ncbi:hypothetical protein CJP74_07010 [Psittacicella melopsittaci]|uniref:Porin n=1 Tax=Psittacicella melopsittaci TaxID=2028576 RepID=A0A3A1Y5S8_9GAMM|nr:porin [Psittacicella melopsittaci]RIY31547.1 hypothetical protein CJP74_07010 [Psittacicella melopsittaci]